MGSVRSNVLSWLQSDQSAPPISAAIRGDDLAQGPTLAQIAETLHYETSEMEYYLSCMVDLNFIMVVGGQIYII